MKNILTLLIFTFSSICIGQTIEKVKGEKFEYSEVGLNDYVVTNIEGKTKEEMYKKAMNWVKETYKNPDLVLKMNIENEKFRIDAAAIGIIKVRGISMNLGYVIEISFRDNKYRFELVSLLYDNTTDYKKMPNFKTDPKLVKNFGNAPSEIENYFNSLNKSLEVYIVGKAEEKW
jgi:hypothetical protein